MHISPADADKLLLSVAGMVARDRLARGVRLNHPEAVALLSHLGHRAGPGGRHASPTSWSRDATVLGPRPGHGRRRRDDRRRPGRGDLPRRPQARHPPPPDRLSARPRPEPNPEQQTVPTSGPGAIRAGPAPSRINADRSDDERLTLVIVNTGDRPIQIGSHLHLPDSNTALDFDRAAAHGFRLDIPSRHRRCASSRGSSREVAAVALRGRRARPGPAARPTAHREGRGPRWLTSTGARYAALYGPTAGDQVRLGDTDLWIEVEDDLHRSAARRPSSAAASRSASRWPRARGPAPRAPSTPSSPTRSCSTTGASCAPTSASGPAGSSPWAAAGNPDIADGVHPDLEIGPGTDVISGEGRILTAGGVDLHVHFLSHQPGARGPGRGPDHPRRWRHRTLRGFQGHHGHPRPRGTCSRSSAAWTTCPSTSCSWARATPSAAAASPSRRSAGAAAYKVPRGLGLDPGGHRRGPAGGRRVRPPGDAAQRQPQRGRLRRLHAAGHRWAQHPRLPHRGRRRRPRAGHHHASPATPTCCPARPTPRFPTPSTPSPSTSTC